MDLKSRISTPLEAGTSILDAHKLPSYLIPALEYTSQRLADKGLHVTIVVVRRDYQLPYHIKMTNLILSAGNPVSNLPSPPCSPISPEFVACGPSFSTIKSLVRSSSEKHDGRQPQRSKTRAVPKRPSLALLFDSGLARRWSTAAHHAVPSPSPSLLPKTPRTPATPASFATTPSSSTNSAAAGFVETRGGGGGDGICLILTTPLAPRAYKLINTTLARAAWKFNLNVPLRVHEPSTYNFPPVVLHGSILQNEILHSSEGMTLLSLDHLYTFKAALCYFAVTRSLPGNHFRLEDAVDELRRYVLSAAGGRRRLLKSTLVQAYDWLGPVNDSALVEVMKMYSRAYGGATEMGVEDDLVKIHLNQAPEVTASKALAAVDAELRMVGPAPELPARFTARLTRMQSVATVTASSTATTVSPPATPKSQSAADSPDSASTPASQQSQQLLPPMSNRNWVVEDYTPWADEGTVSLSESPLAESPMIAPVTKEEKVDTTVEELNVILEAKDGDGGKTPVAPKESAQRHGKISTTPLLNIPPPPSAPPPVPPHQTTSASRVTPRASLPSLRVQTSFATVPKPIAIPPRRKTTLAPIPSSEERICRQEALEDLAIRPSAIGKGLRIEIAIPVSDFDFDFDFDDDDEDDVDDADDDDDDDDAESVLTEFEDGDVTARSPVAKTPGGSFWPGIDEILGGGSSSNTTTTTNSRPRGGGDDSHHHHKWHSSSSLLRVQTPAGGGEAPGPMTPNGYDDISPITRGEWGFLMVGETFRTKTAAVSCV